MRVGEVYHHRLPGNVIETATVLEVGKDRLGIPHVIYERLVDKTEIGRIQEMRTLALESFNERFFEPETEESYEEAV
ncbi:MAG: hypothetical protein AAF530_01825 [Pseudomonadota bacterium]